MADTRDELRRLREENARLKALLSEHGVAWEQNPPAEDRPGSRACSPDPSRLAPDAKVALFRSLFRGREDVFAQRWESAKGMSGYSPACGNEWKPGICQKPRVTNEITNQVIYDHLAGRQTIGVYPLLADDSCYFLAADFDASDWREDAGAFINAAAVGP